MVPDVWKSTECQGGAAQEETRQPPLNVETSEPAKGKGKELTSPAVNHFSFFDGHGDPDLNAEMLQSVSEWRSEGGAGRGKRRSGRWTDQEEEEEKKGATRLAISRQHPSQAKGKT